MKILCLTHADFETPGQIEFWAKEKKYDFSTVKPYRGEEIPDIRSFDILIVMGGPQSPRDTEEFEYLTQEIAFIKRALELDKKVLGFCLGAQLIGEALGAKVCKSPEKEIGVYPIMLTEPGKKDALLQEFPGQFPVIHWHGDMPGLTKEAEVLAFSKGCPRQIVRYGPKVYGFQCHLEITVSGIEDLIQAVPEDLNPSKFTQTEQELLSQEYDPIHKKMFQILDRFVEIP